MLLKLIAVVAVEKPIGSNIKSKVSRRIQKNRWANKTAKTTQAK